MFGPMLAWAATRESTRERGIDMSKKQTDPKAEAEKMASLGIVWSVLAGVAYLGLIKAVVDPLEKNGWAGPTISTHGLRNLTADSTGFISADLFKVALVAMPFAIGAALLLAIAGRIRPDFVPVPAVFILAAVVGLAGSVALFLNQVYTPANRLGFLVALGTIVGVWILLRLERYVRRLHRLNPAVSTLLIAVLVIIYLVASTSANISSIVLKQIDVWLAVVALIIVLYAAIRLLQESLRLQR
jgi:hypothetical protein